MGKQQFDIDWVQVVDIFAHEYGWTIGEIKQLTARQVNLLIDAISRRYQAQAGTMNGKNPEARAMPTDKFQADDEERVIGTMIAWGAKKEIGEDGKERYIL